MSFWQGFEKQAQKAFALGMRGPSGQLASRVNHYKPGAMRLPVPSPGPAPSLAFTVPKPRVPGASVPQMPRGTPKTKMQRHRGVSSTPI